MIDTAFNMVAAIDATIDRYWEAEKVVIAECGDDNEIVRALRLKRNKLDIWMEHLLGNPANEYDDFLPPEEEL